METVRFSATWDTGLIAVTIFAVLMILLAIGGVVVTAVEMGATHHSIALAFVVGAFAIPGPVTLWMTYRWAPKAFRIDDTSVTVERPADPVVIPLASIRQVEDLPPNVSLARVVGSGGLFGYFGTFKNAELGTVRLYATRSSGRVLLRTDTGSFVLTPSPLPTFLSELRKRLQTGASR